MMDKKAAVRPNPISSDAWKSFRCVRVGLWLDSRLVHYEGACICSTNSSRHQLFSVMIRAASTPT